MSFYHILHDLDPVEAWACIQHADIEQCRELLDSDCPSSGYGLASLPLLLSDAATELMGSLRNQAIRLTKSQFDRRMQLYAPLYVSNVCINSCKYCGFNVRNKLERKSLTIDQAVHEASHLYDLGIRNILIVSGESPADVPVAYLQQLAEALKPDFPKISIEVYPLQEEDYRSLNRAGIDGITLYQETYSQKLYPRYHRGPKADFLFRLETVERAARAGFRRIGIGALLGLARPQVEMWVLANHAAYLKNQFPKIDLSLSFPRIRHAEGEFKPDYEIGDAMLEQIIYALRLVLPEADLVLSTRETQAFRNIMMTAGITRMSAGSKTNPGGYQLDQLSQSQPSLEQFQITDERPPNQLADDLKKAGLEPVFD